MSAVVVAILDRDGWTANTDVIVIADASKRRLTWVPRDLWSPMINDRINAAFTHGGGALCSRRWPSSAFRPIACFA